MPVFLTKRWGESVADPEQGDFISALEELSVNDPEHPDCWLENEDGWVISVFSSGVVVFEGPRREDGVSYMPAIPRKEILRLWSLLREGKLNEIRLSPWVPGRP
jgi:hypothetical protein